MEKGTIGLNKETIRDQAVVRVSHASCRGDSGLTHLFNELELEVRRKPDDYLDRMDLIKESACW
ncbi:MAG: hypothetical protein R2758_03325 [Bacteroidales bacterium]